MIISKHRFSPRWRQAIAGTAAAATLGGLFAGCGSSATTAATTAAKTTAAAPASTVAPARRAGAPPGFGKEASGAAASKAKAAALAKYPGTVERVMQLGDGSYVVHVIRRSGGEVHVKVSKAFVVTGTEQGMPGGRTPPTADGTTSQQ